MLEEEGRELIYGDGGKSSLSPLAPSSVVLLHWERAGGGKGPVALAAASHIRSRNTYAEYGSPPSQTRATACMKRGAAARPPPPSFLPFLQTHLVAEEEGEGG